MYSAAFYLTPKQLFLTPAPITTTSIDYCPLNRENQEPPVTHLYLQLKDPRCASTQPTCLQSRFLMLCYFWCLSCLLELISCAESESASWNKLGLVRPYEGTKLIRFRKFLRFAGFTVFFVKTIKAVMTAGVAVCEPCKLSSGSRNIFAMSQNSVGMGYL